ncbi:MAG: bifunctional lysine ketoglutarate reductase /saccharopine dehydrogenase family protein [Fidelibacterota bacterium]
MRIGIRREDKNDYEARVPLIPEHVLQIREKSAAEIFIQPSAIRAFRDTEYRQAGAAVSEDLSGCDLILAVKEIPINYFLPGKKYIFFSHTIKGQPYNMPTLKRMVDLKTTLIDYEKIVDENGRRLVFFGRFAGIAGMIDSFWALGKRLQDEGISTLFANLKPALQYGDLKSVKKAYRDQAQRFTREGIPQKLTPLIVGFAGYGNVSKGAQEIFDTFPYIEIQPEDLAAFYQKGVFSNKHLYKVVFKEEDLVEPRDSSGRFQLREYYQHPEKYKSKFDKHLPYLSMLINAIYWDSRYPRLVTKRYLRDNFSWLPLKVIGDITCDVGGSIECNLAVTDSGNPVYVYNPDTGQIQYGTAGYGPVVLAVDNLPCELPKESSTVFSTVLKDFIPQLLETDFSRDFESVNLPPELKRATILYHGQFTPDYTYMRDYIKNL